MSDYLVTLVVKVIVRVEGFESEKEAGERAVEMLAEELDETSFYEQGDAQLVSVLVD